MSLQQLINYSIFHSSSSKVLATVWAALQASRAWTASLQHRSSPLTPHSKQWDFPPILFCLPERRSQKLTKSDVPWPSLASIPPWLLRRAWNSSPKPARLSTSGSAPGRAIRWSTPWSSFRIFHQWDWRFNLMITCSGCQRSKWHTRFRCVLFKSIVDSKSKCWQSMLTTFLS